MYRNSPDLDMLTMSSDREYGDWIEIQGFVDSENVVDRIIIGKDKILHGDELDGIITGILNFFESQGFIEFTDKLNIQ